MHQDKEIVFLVGFMGCGKSTIGKILAKELDWAFIDADEWIEKKYGMKVFDIFQSHGEDVFRKYETEFIDHADSLSNTIVATGGGMPCHHDAMLRLNALGTTIYLKCGVDALFQRLESDHIRPLLSKMDKRQLKNYIRTTLAQRRRFYELADFTLLAFQDSDRIVKRIIKSKIA